MDGRGHNSTQNKMGAETVTSQEEMGSKGDMTQVYIERQAQKRKAGPKELAAQDERGERDPELQLSSFKFMSLGSALLGLYEIP